MKLRLAEKQQHCLGSKQSQKIGNDNIGENMHGGGVKMYYLRKSHKTISDKNAALVKIQ